MSEGRTPTATLTQQRQLEQKDIDILHQIVIRAQNDPTSEERPKDALLQAYNEIYKERHLNQREDRVCVDILFQLLDPATPGESLYHKFETVLRDRGIVLAFDDDATTQDEHADWISRRGDATAEFMQSPARFSGPSRKLAPRLATTDLTDTPQYPGRSFDQIDAAAYGNGLEAAEDDDLIENPPPYISLLLKQAEDRDRTVLARQTLEVWRDAMQVAKERQLDARADALFSIRLKRKVLKQCLAVFQDLRDAQMQADQMYLRRLAGNVLGKTCDEYRVRRVASIDEDRLKGVSLYKWTVASREARFARARDVQLKRTIMRRLIDRYGQEQARQAELEGLLAQRQAQRQTVLLRSAMAFFSQKVLVHQESVAAADSRNHNALCQASMKIWHARTKQVDSLALTAEDAREYFLMKRVLTRLRNVTRFRKERRGWLAKWSILRWRAFTKNRKHARYDEIYRQVRRSIKMSLARTMFLKWQQTMNKRRDDEAQADALYHKSLTQRIVRPVVETTYEVAEWVDKNEAIADRQADHFLLRKAMLAIQMQQQSLSEMANRADRLQQYRVEQRAVQGLRQMQLKAFELQRRTFDADAFRSRSDKRTVRNVLAKLRTTYVQQRQGGEGALTLVPAPVITPAKKREELLLNSSTRLSTTPAYTPFALRLRQEPRVLEDIDDEDENGLDETRLDSESVDIEP